MKYFNFLYLLIEGVFLRGEYFSHRDLDRLLVEAKDLARNPDQ